LRRTIQQFLEDHLLQWAAALTFYSVLSLFPGMLAVASVLGLLGTSAIGPLIEHVGSIAPSAGRDITLDALRAIKDNERSGATFLVGLGIALWSSSAYVGAFIPAANIVWDVDEARPLPKKIALRIALTLVLMLLITVIALGVVLTGPIVAQVGNALGVGDAALRTWGLAKWPVLALSLMALLALLYWAAPNVRHAGWRWVLPGSVSAVALWALSSAGFTVYVSHIASFNALYGAIGGVLVFLLWLWLTNIAILLGAVLTAELERTRALEPDPRDHARPFLPLPDGPTSAAPGPRRADGDVRSRRTPRRFPRWADDPAHSSYGA
jgi:membrane protein